MEHRGDKDKAVNELKSKIESLTVQLRSAKKDASEAMARMESLNTEMKSYQLNATSATVSFLNRLRYIICNDCFCSLVLRSFIL